MKVDSSLMVLTVAGLLTASLVGAAAYSTFSTTRDATIDVSADANGVLALNADPDSSLVTNTGGSSGEELTIDTTVGSSSGVNVNSNITIGDDASPTSEYAFSVTNNGGAARTVSMAYELSTSDADTTTDNVDFRVYNATAESVGTFSESSSMSSTLASSDTIYVVMSVNTTSLSSSETLSGDLTVSAS